MQTSASTKINATREQVWNVVTDIEKAKDRIECILDIEVLEKPDSGLVGLKWKEKREMFGKEATETMWIIEAKEYEYYIAEAKNSGALYHSKVELSGEDGDILLAMSFKSTPQTFMAKLLTPMMFMMKGMIKKAFIKDMEDIKKSLSK